AHRHGPRAWRALVATLATTLLVSGLGALWAPAAHAAGATTTVTVGTNPIGIAITPDGSHAYVANANSDNVSVIDTTSNTVAKTITVGSTPSWVAITPDGSHAYVANANSDNVSVIDTTSNTVAKTI